MIKFPKNFKIFNPDRPSTSNSKEREPYDPLKHGVSQTCLETWLVCREMARLRYHQGWKPTDTKLPFLQGSMYHDLMKLIYSGIRSSTVKTLSHISSRVKSFISEAEEKHRKEGRQSLLDTLQESYDHASVLIPAYFRHHPKDLTQEWIYVEDKFSFPIYVADFKVAINFVGVYDGGFRRNGKLWIEERKFKSRWPENISDLLPLDLQTCSYTGAAKQTGHDVAGCRYSIIRKPQLKRGKLNRRDFIQRVSADIDERPSFYFERHDIPFSKAECEANLRRMTHLVSNFYRWWKTEDHKSMDLMFNSRSCETVYGTCDYLKICRNQDTSGFRLASGLRD